MRRAALATNYLTTVLTASRLHIDTPSNYYSKAG